MSVITNVYSVNQIKQLIDLNQNKTNFEDKNSFKLIENSWVGYGTEKFWICRTALFLFVKF